MTARKFSYPGARVGQHWRRCDDRLGDPSIVYELSTMDTEGIHLRGLGDNGRIDYDGEWVTTTDLDTWERVK